MIFFPAHKRKEAKASTRLSVHIKLRQRKKKSLCRRKEQHIERHMERKRESYRRHRHTFFCHVFYAPCKHQSTYYVGQTKDFFFKEISPCRLNQHESLSRELCAKKLSFLLLLLFFLLGSVSLVIIILTFFWLLRSSEKREKKFVARTFLFLAFLQWLIAYYVSLILFWWESSLERLLFLPLIPFLTRFCIRAHTTILSKSVRLTAFLFPCK